MTYIQPITKFSPNNIYANKYYSAYDEFTKARDKLIKFEKQSDDRRSPAYMKLKAEFEYWDKQVPKTSNVAAKEEDRLEQIRENKNLEQNFTMTDPNVGNKLNFLA